jgi:hypothetical protein
MARKVTKPVTASCSCSSLMDRTALAKVIYRDSKDFLVTLTQFLLNLMCCFCTIFPIPVARPFFFTTSIPNAAYFLWYNCEVVVVAFDFLVLDFFGVAAETVKVFVIAFDFEVVALVDVVVAFF